MEAVVRAVLATGYNGPLSLEIFRSSFPPGSSSRIAAESYELLAGLIEKTAF